MNAVTRLQINNDILDHFSASTVLFTICDHSCSKGHRCAKRLQKFHNKKVSLLHGGNRNENDQWKHRCTLAVVTSLWWRHLVLVCLRNPPGSDKLAVKASKLYDMLHLKSLGPIILPVNGGGAKFACVCAYIPEWLCTNARIYEHVRLRLCICAYVCTCMWRKILVRCYPFPISFLLDLFETRAIATDSSRTVEMCFHGHVFIGATLAPA